MLFKNILKYETYKDNNKILDYGLHEGRSNK